MTASASSKPRAALARMLAERSEELASEMVRARRGRMKAVHRARTASRRLRELLPVAATAASGATATRARRDVRRITRALGQLRELDVALGVLEEMAERRRWNAGVVADLRRELESAREGRAAALGQALDGTLAARLQARCDAVIVALDATRSQRWRRALASRLRRRAMRLNRTIAAAGTLYAPDALHRVRIAVKKLRYALELAHLAARRPVGRMLAVLKQAQDGLGHWHDVQVLEDFVRRLDSDSVNRVRGTEYTRVATALELECRASHARFLAEREALARVSSGVVREIAPALSRKAVPGRSPRPASPKAAAAE